MGRKQGCVIKNSAAMTPPAKTSTPNTNAKKVMPHDEFIHRIRKTLYFGHDFYNDDDDEEEMESLQVSKPLAEYASELFSDAHRGHTLNRLSCVEASSVQTATPAALIMALIYLDRLNISDPGYVRRITPQELFIVSMIISTKFYAGHDEEIYLSDWAEDGNMSEDRLKQLELEFLSAIEWNIYISNEQFFDKLTCVEKTLARREGLKRGWLTYTELMQMLPSFTLAKFFLNNITVMAVSYAASVMTIAGAFFLASQIPGTSLHRNTNRSPSDLSSQSGNGNNDLLSDTDPGSANLPYRNGSDTAKSGSSVMIMRQHNQTANTTASTPTPLGFNVDDELLKLERQYREEAIRDRESKKQNEIATESRLTLPQQQLMAKLNVNQKCAKYNVNQKQLTYGDWYAHKEVYSDYQTAGFQQLPPSDIEHFHNHLIKRSYDNSENIFTNHNYSNSSMASFWWHILGDTLKQSTFIRLPFMWLKFM